MEAVVATFNQEKALVGAFSVITNLRMELFESLQPTQGIGSQPPIIRTHTFAHSTGREDAELQSQGDFLSLF